MKKNQQKDSLTQMLVSLLMVGASPANRR